MSNEATEALFAKHAENAEKYITFLRVGIKELGNKLNAAEAELDELRWLLRECQFSHSGRWLNEAVPRWEWRDDLCHICGEPSTQGHAPDCKIAKALEEEE